MNIGDKVEYKEDGFIYQGIVVAIAEDGSKVKISVRALGKVIEQDI